MTGLVTAFGSGAMTNSIADVTSNARAYLIIGSNTTEQHPVIGYGIRRAVQRGARLIVADPRAIPLTRVATLHLQHRPGSDIALLNGLAHIILKEGLHDEAFIAERTEGFEEWRETIEAYTPELVSEITAVPAELLYQAARIYATAKPACLVYAMGITQHTCGHDNVLAAANLALLTGNVGLPGGGVNPLRGQNNVQGACDLGALPNVYSGYQSVLSPDIRGKFEINWGVERLPEKAGLTVMEMMDAAGEGRLKGLYIVGENPMLSDPDVNHVRQCLQRLDFLVVQDIFLTETAQLADVVLPAASFAEKDGTFTNTERRVQRIRRATDPPGDARPDWLIVCELARRMRDEDASGTTAPHAGWDYASPAEIMDEIAALTPSYGGISYERIEKAGLQWPCPAPDHPGTPVLHVGTFSRGLGRFSGIEYQLPAELPDDDYPLVLTTGRRLEHFHSGSMTRRVSGLNELVPEERMEISRADAEELGIEEGDWVRVRSRRGEVRVRVQVNGRCRKGVVFMTFHFAEALANILTNPALDPVSKIPEYKVCAVHVEKISSS